MDTDRKRKIVDCEISENDTLKKQKTSPEDGLISKNLLDYFSDEILLEILNKLDSESLFSLSETCEHFSRLTKDKVFWCNVDFTAVPLTIQQIFARLEKISASTQKLRIMGDCKDQKPADHPFPGRQTFREIIQIIAQKSPLLQEMYFQFVWFDWVKNFQINDFPSNLRKMSFINCSLPNKGGRREPKIFSGIDRYLPNLEEIQVDYCNWFEVIDIMQFSKLKNLKYLSLKGCRKFQNCVPYLSLSCKFGFVALEVLDLRDSNIQDSELHCFNALSKLRELYLEEISTPGESDDEEDYDSNSTPSSTPSFLIRSGSVQLGNLLANRPLSSSNGSSSSNDAPGPSAPSPSSSSAPENFERRDILNFNGQQIERHTIVNTGAANNVATIVIRANVHGNGNASSNPDPPEIPAHVLENPIVFPRQENNGQGVGVLNQISDNYLSSFYSGILNFARRHPIYGNSESTISDRGLLGFGVPRDQLLNNMVFIRLQQRDPNIYIEKLVARNFRGVTDVTLRHLEYCAPRLTFLDITGTAIRKEAIEHFKIIRPECCVISSYD